MNFVDIENTLQGADRKEMEVLFAPFILREINGPDATWDKAVEKRWRRTNWLYFKRRLLGWLPRYQRTDVTIKEEYSEAWDRTDYRSFAVDPTIKPVDPWVWGERRMFASTRGIVRLRQYLLVRSCGRGAFWRSVAAMASISCFWRADSPTWKWPGWS